MEFEEFPKQAGTMEKVLRRFGYQLTNPHLPLARVLAHGVVVGLFSRRKAFINFNSYKTISDPLRLYAVLRNTTKVQVIRTVRQERKRIKRAQGEWTEPRKTKAPQFVLDKSARKTKCYRE